MVQLFFSNMLLLVAMYPEQAVTMALLLGVPALLVAIWSYDRHG